MGSASGDVVANGNVVPINNANRLEFLAQTSRRVLEAAGAGEVIEEYGSYDLFNSSHVFGTCRMGDDPDASVVDATCRSHRWKNLLVTDASAVGIVRAAHLVATWYGPPPTLVLNRAAPRSNGDVITAAKEWTVIEPSAVIPDRPSIRAASLAAKRPDSRIRKPLTQIGASL